MKDFKAYASRALNAVALDTPDRKRWSCHGSTRYLISREAVDYVLRRQDEPLDSYDAANESPAKTNEPRP